MALPGGRLAFERAIRYSSLPAPARHLALTIATWADIGSGVIPERFQPSLSTLAEATGLGVSTVKRHLGTLETEGWLRRERPEIERAQKEHARTKYALAIPASPQEHGPERAMPSPERAMGMAHSEPGHGPERAKARPTAGHKSPLNAVESPGSTSSSPADPEPTAPSVSAGVTDGGGGSDLRSIAEHITAHLDYRGKPPDKRQRKTIRDRLVAALAAGWTVKGLAVYLDLGDAKVDSPAAVYAHRLRPDVIPDAEPMPAAAARGGVFGELPTAAEIEALTVADVFGTSQRDTADGGMWERAAARARQRMGGTPKLRGHQPFQCPPPSAYTHGFGGEPAVPAGGADTPWCGEPDCDPVTRFRDADAGNGLKVSVRCPKCHPASIRDAAHPA